MFDKHKRESLLLRDLLKKLIIIVIGSIVAAYGITLALYAGFGGATLAVLWQGIAETFHLSIGMASFVVAVGMILFALIYDKSQIHIGTVLYQIVYSTCVDVFATCHVYSTYDGSTSLSCCWVLFCLLSGPDYMRLPHLVVALMKQLLLPWQKRTTGKLKLFE